jgi:hypothetical protein
MSAADSPPDFSAKAIFAGVYTRQFRGFRESGISEQSLGFLISFLIYCGGKLFQSEI